MSHLRNAMHKRTRLIIAILTIGSSTVTRAEAPATRSTNPDEVVIRYLSNSQPIPPPHREGDFYVVAIPRRLGPRPEKLPSSFINDLDGDNEVWRFRIDTAKSVVVEQTSDGLVHIRFTIRATAANSTELEERKTAGSGALSLNAPRNLTDGHIPRESDARSHRPPS